MFAWLLRRLGFSSPNGSARVEYDPIYGLSRRALAEWFKWNPELAAQHRRQERSARKRRNKTAAHSGGGRIPLSGTEDLSGTDDRRLKRIETTTPNQAGERSSRSDFKVEPAAEDR
jgi:hypothetical protein